MAAPAVAQEVPYACPVVSQHFTANGDLRRSRAAVANGSLTILAMGSSSIQGHGASRPELSFVPLLEMGLERRMPGVEVTVINRGVGGETAMETEGRLEAEVTMTLPDLVIWQLGTNDVLRDRPLADVIADFHRGADILDRLGVDVLLIDPQRLPDETMDMNFKGRNPGLEVMSRHIEAEAAASHFAVLHRFRAMQDWNGLEHGGVGPDDLHLNDGGYACWAAIAAEGLASALQPGTSRPPRD